MLLGIFWLIAVAGTKDGAIVMLIGAFVNTTVLQDVHVTVAVKVAVPAVLPAVITFPLTVAAPVAVHVIACAVAFDGVDTLAVIVCVAPVCMVDGTLWLIAVAWVQPEITEMLAVWVKLLPCPRPLITVAKTVMLPDVPTLVFSVFPLIVAPVAPAFCTLQTIVLFVALSGKAKLGKVIGVPAVFDDDTVGMPVTGTLATFMLKS